MSSGGGTLTGTPPAGPTFSPPLPPPASGSDSLSEALPCPASGNPSAFLGTSSVSGGTDVAASEAEGKLAMI